MSLAYALLIGVLFAVGSFLLMHRTLTRIILGVAMIGNGINVMIVAVSSRPGRAPIVGEAEATDSVPQALVLTAIVIGFALIAFMLALAWRNWTIDGNDTVEDDVEDRRVARRTEPDGGGGES
ncbi:MAG: NADH-quinone oxidoreductase subunit K [Actinomycetota bacterium]|nr:NADH-quinone oxidoreductase subunit K [Actinomycetota bacterium]MDA2972424.1 NADH-quinone oxidoreductase subunit K [Actinomycetota bacterium]MDA3001862.1 NADH-quinone oxidoreductase subunit K [Actinomycetota bacterium]